MADIVFRYTEMRKTAEDIRTISASFKTAADTLQTEFTDATKEWEGTSKDAMQSFMTGKVYQYTAETIPQLLEALAALLEGNADSMEKADQTIAENIPTSA